MAPLRTWAREFAHWIKSLFGTSEQRRPTIVADDYHANGALYRIHDSNIPGCVELWKIVQRQSGSDLVVVLLDLAQLRQELGASSALPQAHTEPWQNRLTRQLAVEIKTQSSVEGSHLIVCCWLRDRAGVDAKNRRYRVPVAVLVGVWTCELQGVLGALNGNRIAIAICKAVAYKLFRAKNANPLIWEQFVNQVPWLEWLDTFAKHYLGQDHVLQPVKRKPSRPVAKIPKV